MRVNLSSLLRRQRGVSMIEVMVAVLVLSVGLLGMGTLMAVSLRNTQSASYRTQAANLAYEYTDIARSYVARGSNSKLGSVTISNFTSPTCNLATAPAYNCGSGSNALNCDARRFADRVCRVLPGGRIRADAQPVAGAARRVALTVDVCWLDDRSEEAVETAGCTSDSETLFTLTTEL
ncbi:type IV pilus assembly protein PilV [Aquimonas voraii]|uniref:Type IV pilus assembly protein PilV n=1 Tax=Aquimonas voraii TaxID=265719 RepID=A0A1G6S1M7_9GAMM|nr:type IV pilus assembly protein PilV [Aquimonas voraii]